MFNQIQVGNQVHQHLSDGKVRSTSVQQVESNKFSVKGVWYGKANGRRLGTGIYSNEICTR